MSRNLASPPREAATPAGDLTHCGDPLDIGQPIALDSSGFVYVDPAAALAASATTMASSTPSTHGKRARPARAPMRGRMAAELIAAGMPIDKVAAKVGVNVSTVWRWQHETTWWPEVSRRAQATVAADTDAEMAAGRLEAVRALRRVVAPVEDDAPLADPNEVSSAARALLIASAPPGEQARRLAAREARASWLAALAPEDPTVRARILARIDGDLDDPSISTAELEALAARERR